MGSIIALISSVFTVFEKLLSQYFRYREKEQIRTEVKAELILEQDKENKLADEAREEQRRNDAASPDPRLHDDGFRRD